jgi:hypothetical protein
MQIPMCVATLHTDQPVRGNPSALRGFIGSKFPENVLLHQHMQNGKTAYLYPRVQYRVTRGVAQIIAVSDGIAALHSIVDSISDLELNGSRYTVHSIDWEESTTDVAECPTHIHYRFDSPWLALSQKNYHLYQQADIREQSDMLTRILIGNVLSFCKSLDVIVTERLEPQLFVRPKSVIAKRQKMIGFTGRFRLNFRLPEMFGLGHLVSIGFGSIVLNERAVTTK